MDGYMNVASSKALFIICFIPICIIWIQSAIFLKKSLRQARLIGVQSPTIKKIISSTIVFSIMPSLPILVTMATLMPILGKYIPWLRLSVIGNAVYESMAADMAVKSYGLSGLGDPGITLPMFGTIVWAMTIGIMLSPICSTFLLKSYDKKLKIAQSKPGFLSVAIGSLFIGLLSLLAIPRLLNFKDMIGLLSMISAAITAIALNFIAKNFDKKIISDFVFPISMIVGMISSLLWSAII